MIILKKLQRLIFAGEERSIIVKKNIIGSFANKGLSVIIQIILVPLTLGYVSSELYGIWLTLTSVVGWLSILDAGFHLGLKNKLAEAIALNQWERGKELVSTTYFMMFVIFIPLGLILNFIIPLVNWSSFLNVKACYNDEITKVMFVLVAFLCIRMIIQTINAIIAAFQKTALSGMFDVIGNFLALCIIFVLTKTCPPSLIALAFSLTMTPLIVLLVATIILFNNKFKRVSPSIRYIRKKHVGDIFSLGYKFFIIMLQVVIMYQATNFLISNIGGPTDVTSYNIAYKYLGVSTMIINIILTPIWPAFTDSFTKKDYPWMRRIYKKMTTIEFIVIAGIVLMVAISPFVYHIWIGHKAIIPLAMSIIVGVYMMVDCWLSLHMNILNGMGTIQLQLYVTLIGLVAHIPLSFFIGHFIGPLGVVCSQTIITFIYCIFLTYQVHKILNQKAKGLLLK